ncbi:MAG: 3-isopropylmalate dehydrogenase [Deltaproteobacteria bacterium]|nr:3-isopropylmalate dehydrogenase [Deltaproteobacteria bacterium]
MKILILPGDGIGTEVAACAAGVLKHVVPDMELDYGLIGGSAYEATGSPLPEETKTRIATANAVLLGAVGGTRWDTLPQDKKPEAGLLGLRAHMQVFANLRPARIFQALCDASSLKGEVLSGVDLIIVRELIGGIYFGKPRGVETMPDGTRRAYNTLEYSSKEIERIAHKAFGIALKRSAKLTSVDKANVLESSRLWREVVDEIATGYPSVEVSHMYVDNCAMQLIRKPSQFDVILTQNLFGDILSDEASMVTGSLGMLPSASIGEGPGLYEPVHGSAPDIAGQDKANPIGAILSVAMMLRYSFDMEGTAHKIETAVEKVLSKGIRTLDLAAGARKIVGTQEMTDCIIQEMENT